MKNFSIILIMVMTAHMTVCWAQQQPISATDLAFDVYNSCLKEFRTDCVKPKAMKWFRNALKSDQIYITEKLSVVRTNGVEPYQMRSLDANEQMFNDIDNFLATHALRMQPAEFFQDTEARSYIPDFLMDNTLTKGALIPLTESTRNEGRGMMRKVFLPFLMGLKFKTFIIVPLALALIALKTWKAMTLGLLSLVLSGALVIFKIAKPKIVNYEVVHYPHHVEHIEHVPHHHHVEHVVPHHIEHIVPHHLDHHLDHHHVEHLEIPHHVEHDQPSWDPHAWSRSSQEPKDAQDIAYAGQKRR